MTTAPLPYRTAARASHARRAFEVPTRGLRGALARALCWLLARVAPAAPEPPEPLPQAHPVPRLPAPPLPPLNSAEWSRRISTTTAYDSELGTVTFRIEEHSFHRNGWTRSETLVPDLTLKVDRLAETIARTHAQLELEALSPGQGNDLTVPTSVYVLDAENEIVAVRCDAARDLVAHARRVLAALDIKAS